MQQDNGRKGSLAFRSEEQTTQGRTKALVEAQTVEARNNIENAILESTRPFEKDGVIEIPMPAMLACARKP